METKKMAIAEWYTVEGPTNRLILQRKLARRSWALVSRWRIITAGGEIVAHSNIESEIITRYRQLAKLEPVQSG